MQGAKEPPSLNDIDTAPADLPDPAGADDSETINKLKDDFARVSNEAANAQLELQQLKRQNKADDILNSLIEPFAKNTFLFMCFYSVFIGFIIILHVSGWGNKELSDAVLQVLVGSTAVTVIGLVGMVLTGIFVGARKKGGSS